MKAASVCARPTVFISTLEQLYKEVRSHFVNFFQEGDFQRSGLPKGNS